MCVGRQREFVTIVAKQVIDCLQHYYFNIMQNLLNIDNRGFYKRVNAMSFFLQKLWAI